MCRNQTTDLKLGMDAAGDNRLTVHYSVVTGRNEHYNERLTLWRVAGELRGRLEGGAGPRIVMALRPDGDINVKWIRDSGHWCSGVVRRTSH